MMKLALVETKLLTREPGALFSLLIPLFILVVFGSSIQPGDTVLLPMALAIAVGLVGLYLLPTTLATYRERGILRRLSITPVHPGSLLVVQLLLQLVLVVVACGLLMAVAGTVLGAHLPALVFSGVLAFLLGTASMFAIGSLVAALAPNGRAANGFGVLLYFPMAYLAGLMQPVDQMPDMVALVGTFTPLGAFVESLRDVWAGSAPSLLTLGVMAAYTLVIGLVATKFFRWE
ncbi:ABC-2 type transport system permease protein [Nonomuraea thailandensis]|uniref:Transport permease protein n=1 Tax=Nonomuraea thailandensis TaxID=1188745 RepID=A0A9X2GU77_9ACTN|nr:ABC transporter permease [Nonomuraea thailandensis]MCP2363829.1 ABC-2 type transport system permease protein [Nonomuraea thailandensis]